MSPRSRNMLLSSAFMLLGFVGLSRIGAQGAIPPHFPLSNFPDRVGEWTGVRLPMDEKTKALLNADSYSSILFTNTPGTPGILFFSIYYDRQTPEKNIHSPANCLPSSGWAILSHRVDALRLNGPSQPPVNVNVNVIQKGLDKQLVLYWYQERGHLFANEYRGRIYLIRDALFLHRSDGALVRVSMPIRHSVQDAFRTEARFLRTLAPLLPRYIPGSSGQMKLAKRTNKPGLSAGVRQ